MKTVNEIAQWGFIGLIMLFMFGLDFDLLETTPKRVSTLETQISEQSNKINSLEEKVTNINNKLQSAVTLEDLKNLQETSAKERAGSSIVETIDDQVLSDETLNWSLFEESYIWIVLVAIAGLLGAFIALHFIKKVKQKPRKAQVIELKSVPENQNEFRDRA